MARQDLQRRTSLVLSVRFLHGRYHGSEWPPSPRRLFLALVYALYMGRGRVVGISEGEKALQSLEGMEPPDIYAPRMERGCRYTIFVPNNDRDIPKKPEKLKTSKILSPYIADEPVLYSWRIGLDNQDDAKVLCRLAKGIPALGLGIDPVATHGQVTEEPTVQDRLLRYVPNDQGKSLIQVPVTGLLANAKRRHETFRTRLEDGRYTKPAEITNSRPQGYSTKISKIVLTAFRINRIEEGSMAPVQKGIIPGSMAPNLIREVERIKDGLVGVDNARRVRTALLPSIGGKHADAMIRRIAFLAPPGMSDTVEKIDGRMLNVGANTYQLEALGTDDPVLRTYKQSSRFFASVTPVKMRQVRGTQAPIILSGMLENETGNAVTYIRINNEAHWGTKNVIGQNGAFAELEFESRVSGPIIVGDGQEQGYGLLVPMTVPDVAYFRILGRSVPVLMALAVGSAMRRAALSKIRRSHALVPTSISGHESDGGPLRRNHDHAFWLPLDSNRDGLIDHIAVYMAGGLDHITKKTLGKITRVYDGSGVNLNVRLVDFFVKRDMKDCTLFGSGTKWVSATPYFMPWHVKKGFGLEAQLKKECEIRKYGNVSIAHHEIKVDGRNIPKTLFVSRYGEREPISKTGETVELEFKRDIRGPIALGFGCHFGLGMFVPALNS